MVYEKQQWDTTSYINPTRMNHIEDGIKANSNEIESVANNVIAYGECTTARSTSAKVVSCSGFVLKKGSRIAIRFTDTGNSNPSSGNLTLNVNGTGAKTIVDGHANKTILTYANGSYFYNNLVAEFVYDGTYWVYMNRDANTTYTGATLKTGAAKTGSGTTVTDTIAKSTTIDNAIQTLLNNDVAINSNLTNINQSLGNKVNTTDSRLSDARTPKAHTHDDRYYTETEIDNKFLKFGDAISMFSAQIITAPSDGFIFIFANPKTKDACSIMVTGGSFGNIRVSISNGVSESTVGMVRKGDTLSISYTSGAFEGNSQCFYVPIH